MGSDPSARRRSAVTAPNFAARRLDKGEVAGVTGRRNEQRSARPRSAFAAVHVAEGAQSFNDAFSFLGPLEVTDGDRKIPLAAPKQRALLTVLLLHGGEPVSIESLVEQLWAGEPPTTATKAIRVYVGQLRKALGPGVIVTQTGGFAIPLHGHETDVARFEDLAAEGRRRLDDGDAETANPSSGVSRFVGTTINIQVPGYGNLLAEGGTVTIDFTTDPITITREAGPHPFLHDGYGVLCDYLAS